MKRRIYVPGLRVGEVPLDPVQAHHARDVLRLAEAAEVEVFDDAGQTAIGRLIYLSPHETTVRIMTINPVLPAPVIRWTIASAIPKGDRADWMIEKLSELGTDVFIPLATARGIVLPQGTNKRDRWIRLATESAKQSRRRGVMRIEKLTSLQSVLDAFSDVGDKEIEMRKTENGSRRQASQAWVLATEIPGLSIRQALSQAVGIGHLTLLIGPEGGWTPEELAACAKAGLITVRLGETILRVKTAAVAAAAAVSILA